MWGVRSLTWDFILFIYTVTLPLFSGFQELREYCTWDVFEASCQPDEVVIMRQARYGRMRIGQCVKRDFGFLGCQTDVVTHMDSLCSGRRSCEVVIPDETMRDMEPCSELEAYLEASYDCHKVVASTVGRCRSEGRLVLTEPGTIASLSADTDGLGTRRCPWVLQAKPGQQINITLLDFGMASKTGSDPGTFSVVCQRYANIKEPGSRSTTVCGGERRDRNLYVTHGHSVEIEIIPGQPSTPSATFLLKYDFIGCPNPTPAGGSTIERHRNMATVFCPDSHTSWDIYCQDNEWVGSWDNCTAANQNWGIWDVLSNDWSSPYGILVVTCLGVALGVVIGLILLVIALLCMRRKRRRCPPPLSPLPLDMEAAHMHRDSLLYPKDPSALPLVTDSRTKEDGYGCRWKNPRPLMPIPGAPLSYPSDKADSLDFPPPPYSTDTSSLSRSSGVSTFKGRPHEEHIYESPS